MIRCLRMWGRRTAAAACSLLVGAGLLGGEVPAASAAPSGVPTISLMIDGMGVSTDVKPIIQNGRMLVPIRAIAENIGADITYEQAYQRITLKQGGQEMALFLGKPLAYVNGKKLGLDASPILVKGRTLVPVRFVSQALGYTVKWEPRSKVASVTTGAKEVKAGRGKLDTTRLYVVQPGDTLSAIAKKHRVETGKLVSLNRLNPDVLLDGQVLVLTADARSSQKPLPSVAGEKGLLRSDFVFPLSPDSSYDPFVDTYGNGRGWVNGRYEEDARSHEGIDIMAPQGTPVFAVSDGWINRLGWNAYGGWRVNVTDESGKYRFYYAHLKAYAPGLKQGGAVKAGQLLGFVGNSGYGASGTTGKFPSHLHFGLYSNATGKPMNPFYYLQFWEKQSMLGAGKGTH